MINSDVAWTHPLIYSRQDCTVLLLLLLVVQYLLQGIEAIARELEPRRKIWCYASVSHRCYCHHRQTDYMLGRISSSWLYSTDYQPVVQR